MRGRGIDVEKPVRVPDAMVHDFAMVVGPGPLAADCRSSG